MAAGGPLSTVQKVPSDPVCQELVSLYEEERMIS